ncbi:hypothetical protein [Alkalitalea saponilacus]|uniref:Uncharacterized protein n=1 Tax=Alkalitalea saponilacus TaxID=889453 RepID=A0A1T5HTF2_9BACT|nr:hypothetical protein [Alkalitalea saponilacus]ASB50183.1 hypothetical protein CDL62_14070 [Alkalitalea saponilacus]SKC23968.1 hypothetical protein SAMN03080601_03255 [Alkalitalea saponilacus]
MKSPRLKLKQLLILSIFLKLHLFTFAESYYETTPFVIKSEDLINVFLDCPQCDINYIQQNIPFVNYVRDRGLADIHVLITIHHAGTSGSNYELSFIGQNIFRGSENKLRYWTDATNGYSGAY